MDGQTEGRGPLAIQVYFSKYTGIVTHVLDILLYQVFASPRTYEFTALTLISALKESKVHSLSH